MNRSPDPWDKWTWGRPTPTAHVEPCEEPGPPRIKPLLHRLGFHGPNWEPFWFDGNVWIECAICGARRFLPTSEDLNAVPPDQIAPHSRFPDPREDPGQPPYKLDNIGGGRVQVTVTSGKLRGKRAIVIPSPPSAAYFNEQPGPPLPRRLTPKGRMIVLLALVVAAALVLFALWFVPSRFGPVVW